LTEAPANQHAKSRSAPVWQDPPRPFRTGRDRPLVAASPAGLTISTGSLPTTVWCPCGGRRKPRLPQSGPARHEYGQPPAPIRARDHSEVLL